MAIVSRSENKERAGESSRALSVDRANAECSIAGSPFDKANRKAGNREGDRERSQSPFSSFRDSTLFGPIVAEGSPAPFSLLGEALGASPERFDSGSAISTWRDAIEFAGDAAPRRRLQGNRALAREARRGAEAERGALGLVRAAYLTVYPDSRLVRLHLPTFGAEAPEGTRGKVSGMSDESRRRLMGLLHTVKRSAANPAFITLTFPDDAIPEPREAKRILQTFFKRWRRRDSNLCAVWRLEAHPARSLARGAAVPHFHLLVWGAWIDRFQLSKDWADVVKAPGYMAHLSAGTKVESIRSFRGVCSYASKYISKAEEYSLGESAGRVWGIFNRDALPVGQSVSVPMTAAQTVAVVRHVKRFLHSRGVKTEWMPREIYLERPGDVLRLINTP